MILIFSHHTVATMENVIGVDRVTGTTVERSIFATIFDHSAPTGWPANPRTPLELATLSRELGINDPQRGTGRQEALLTRRRRSSAAHR